MMAKECWSLEQINYNTGENYKYRFYDLRYSKEPLPEDVNEDFIKWTASYNDPRIEKLIKKMQYDKRNDKAVYSKDGRIEVILKFRNGVIQDMDMIQYINGEGDNAGTLYIIKTPRNKKVYFESKNNYHEYQRAKKRIVEVEKETNS